METALYIVGGFAAGWIIRGAIVRWALTRIAKQAGLDLEKIWDEVRAEARGEKPDAETTVEIDSIVHVKLEEHHGHYYMFREDNDQFLAQGSTFNEIRDLIKAKHPEITIAAAPGTDPEVLARFKATKA